MKTTQAIMQAFEQTNKIGGKETGVNNLRTVCDNLTIDLSTLSTLILFQNIFKKIKYNEINKHEHKFQIMCSSALSFTTVINFLN